MSPATNENNPAPQDASTSMMRVHLKRVRELFDQYESVDIGSAAGRKKARRERLMADMDHE